MKSLAIKALRDCCVLGLLCEPGRVLRLDVMDSQMGVIQALVDAGDVFVEGMQAQERGESKGKGKK